MRIRLAMIATAVLFVCGALVFALQRARAEHMQVALLEAEVVRAATAPPASPTSAEVAPAAPGGAPAVAPTAPIAPTPPAVAAQPAVVAPAAVAPTVPVPAPGAIAPPGVRFGGIAAGPGPMIQPTPPNPYYAQGLYPVPQPGGDPETNELASEDQQLEQEVQSLARQLADSEDDKQRAELKDKLAAALEKQFDAQQKLRQLEISRIEARVQKLRELVRKRTESRRKIIENRFEQLLNDAEGLGWNSAKGGGIQFVPSGFPGTTPRAELRQPLAPSTSAPRS